ncbi:hypothetical protein EXU57_05020 [Segetibacter sp. 3557_3]|uniref:hypothetical protein n=1 Tax=Segetibacter sp. 3557_3 TaxID=2547429 RepID=UPI0010588F9A|nr:hypothetical protein [Segetibacter sp. 3557_3]TDH27830.1 hypothetical protein EXU57_05020 [Segetibacter sp. 3557_3]
MVEKILDNEAIVAIIIRSQYNNEGIEFFTPHNFSQQLGYMSRPKGYNVQPHTHRIIERTVTLTQEVLFVKSGKVRISLFDNDGVFLDDKIVGSGDVILLASGGHGLEVLEDAEIVEIKQGPYSGADDKIKIGSVKKHNESKAII